MVTRSPIAASAARTATAALTAGSGLAGQLRLVDLEAVRLEHTGIGGHEVALAHQRDVAGHELDGGYEAHLVVAADPRGRRRQRAQGGDLLRRAAFLADAHGGVRGARPAR